MIGLQHLPIIAIMVYFFAAFVIALIGPRAKGVRIAIALIASAISLFIFCYLIKAVMIEGQVLTYWLGNWTPVEGYAIGIGYELDQLSMFFSLIITTAVFLALIYSVRYMERDSSVESYYTLFLILAGSVLALVISGDLFNMYVMVEIMTFAAVALTAFRNHIAGALEAAFKYLVVGTIGSVFILVGVALLYRQCHTLNMAQISLLLVGQDQFTPTSILAFALLLIGYASKAFLVPFHPLAADAHGSAPAPVSLMISGVLTKTGVYAIIRIVYTIFRAMDMPAVQLLVVLIGTITMFVCVSMALAQHDFKRLLAYHSISQVGYVITAIGLGSALGITSGLFHAMNHTLFKGLLFLCAGAVIHATGTGNLDKLGGLSKKMPKTTICFLIGALSISGIPPFNGFASKWMIYQASFQKAVETNNAFYAVVTIVAIVVSVMTLASFIKVTHAAFFGQTSEACKDAKEVPFSMRLPMWILSALCLLTGLFYNFFDKYLFQPAVDAVLNVKGYLDAMMGAGSAGAAGITNLDVAPVSFDYWDPILWLVLFAIVMAAVCIVVLTGKGARGRVSQNSKQMVDGKYASFYGGEQAEPSHVAGSDLFWGFKRDWRSYYGFMEKAHSGIVRDYARWAVVATAIVILFSFIFIR